MKEPIIHLLIPKQFRVWCLPDKVPDNLTVTNQASKCTCANCLTIMRSKTKNFHRPFRVAHVGFTRKPYDEP